MHPTLLHIGHLTLPTFGLLTALGLMAAMSLALRCAPYAGVPADAVWNATLFAVVAAFALSRLILIATNLRSFLAYPVLLLTAPSLTGLGLLLTGVATLVYLRFQRVPALAVLDAWAAPACALWAALALGHLAEGSDPGLPSRAWWAVRVGADPDLQQPVGLFAAAAAVVLAVVVFRFLQRRHVAGATAAMALGLVGCAQFVLTFLRQPYPYAPDAPNFPLDPIQFLALGMITAGGLLYATARSEGSDAGKDRELGGCCDASRGDALMPSKNMLPKGHRHRSVRAEYVATRGVDPVEPPVIPTLELDVYEEPGAGPAAHTITVPTEAAGLRLDQYLAQAIPEISRSRVQLLLEHGQVKVNGAAVKAKHRVAAGQTVVITGSPRPAPLHATAQDIPLEVVVEDEFLAIVNKPAGMMVHAGAAAARPEEEGGNEEGASAAEGPRHDPRSAGTLVNALLHHFNHRLSSVGGELRPGIVHRLDKQTSGLLVVAKDDVTHRKLGEMFAARQVDKTYLALVHGHIARKDTTVNLPIGWDIVRRTRMTTRRPAAAAGVRSAVSHVHVLERLRTAYGLFTLVEVKIETGRTHQIRVHLQSMGHPVVGDNLYGAPHQIRLLGDAAAAALSLGRNFLHAARLSLRHPRTGEPLLAETPLPAELTAFLAELRAGGSGAPIESTA